MLCVIGDEAKVEGEAVAVKPQEAPATAARLFWLVGVSVLVLLLVVVFGDATYFVLPADDYLRFHLPAEIVAVVVGFSIFAVHWHAASHRKLRQPRALFLGTAFFGAAALDTLHILTFPGMPGVVAPASLDHTIYYWLAARFWVTLALLLALFIGAESRHPLLRRGPLLVLNMGLVAAVVAGNLRLPAESPLFFRPDLGLTLAKLGMEYALIALCLVGSALYWRSYRRTGARADLMIVAALVVTVLSGLSFTFYAEARDTFNLLGHLYKMIAYLLIFDGLFVSSLLRPYAELDRTTGELAASNRDLVALREHVQGELARTIARLEESMRAERRARESAEALVQLANAIAVRSDLSVVLDRLVNEARSLFGADFAALATADEGGGPLTWRAIAGCYRHLFEDRHYVNCGLVDRVMATGEAAVVERSLAEAAESAGEREREAPSTVSAVGVPVGEAGRRFGALIVGYRGQRSFSAEELSLALAVADHAAVAIQEAHLHQEVRRRAAQLDAVIASIADGFIVFDREGNCLHLNPTARSLLSCQANVPVGGLARSLSWYRVTEPEGLPLAPEETPVFRALAGETVVGMDLLVKTPEGATSHLSVSAAPVIDEQGALLGAVATLHDVAAFVEVERRREEFLRIVAHDIRQPLTIIQGQAQLVRHALAAGNRERAELSVQAILTSVQRVNHMIRDLVDAARLEMGQLDFTSQPIDIVEFVRGVLERLSGLEDWRRIRLRTEEGDWTDLTPPAGGHRALRVRADPDSLDRVLGNLLSNAVKYSDSACQVLVTVGCRGSEVVVSVADNGRGIAPEDLPHVFERLFRGGDRRRKEGLGLGLYITKMMVEAHGGRIWVESQVGLGATFSFALPLLED